jgi:uncharacterized protein with PIN domain
MPPARFLTDTSLDLLARRLRMLGYDVATVPGARLEELFEAARRDGRTVLSLSARRPPRFADVPALLVPRADPAAALRALAASHEPAGPPFSRCPICNTALQRRTPFEAAGEVPSRVLRRSPALHYCPHCGKWYWEGSHVARLKAWLAGALGRPIG